jgi:ribonuclease VapC
MVIDSSALVAIFLGGPDREKFLDLIINSQPRRLSAVNAFETGIVLEAKRSQTAGREFDFFLLDAGIEVVPVDAASAELARAAWRQYGKGRHPAGLNFGDCFAYALAKLSDDKLLAKADDFSRTDIGLIDLG